MRAWGGGHSSRTWTLVIGRTAKCTYSIYESGKYMLWSSEMESHDSEFDRCYPLVRCKQCHCVIVVLVVLCPRIRVTLLNVVLLCSCEKWVLLVCCYVCFVCV